LPSLRGGNFGVFMRERSAAKILTA